MRTVVDFQLLIATGVILTMGVLVHFSTAPEKAIFHIGFISAGIICAIIASKIDYNSLSLFHPYLYGFTILLLVLTLVLGVNLRGSTRWIDLGLFRFQPSEPAKIILIICFSQFISNLNLQSFFNLFKYLAYIGLPLIFVFLQPDLGTAILIGTLGASIFFASGVRLKHLLIFLLAGLLVVPFGWFGLKDYQKDRLTTFLNPTAEPLGKGYNSVQSLIAVGSGQITGRGLGHGTQSKLKFLPEYQTDFAFAALAEELGLVGSLILLSAYSWLIFRLTFLAANSPTTFSYLAIIGIIAMFASQIIVNIGMNIGLLPITGITLPLISSGGTSLIVSLTSLGTALKLGQNNRPSQGIEIRGISK